MESEETSRAPAPPKSSVVNDPSRWSISYATLMELDQQALVQLGMEAYSSMTMRDINRELIEPRCREAGTSYALSVHPQGLPMGAFVTHSWDGNFCEFVHAIRSVFQTSVVKPNLWICAFALVQGDHDVIEQQLGSSTVTATATDSAKSSLASSPFAKALKQATKFVVVRNANTDLYARIWCVCELLFAHSLGLVPRQTFVTGPDQFAHSKISCLDAKATEPNDKARILTYLLTEHEYEEIDRMVHLFRTQGTPLEMKIGIDHHTNMSPRCPDQQSLVLESPMTSIGSSTAAQPIQQQQQQQQQQQSLDEESSFARLRSILHPLCDEDELLMREHFQQFAEGTREWVLRGFDDWFLGSNEQNDNHTGRIFVLTAVAGTGKTGIMCKLARDRSEYVAAIHFCRHDDDRRNNPRRMLLSLAYQLSRKFPDYRRQLEVMMEEGTLKEETMVKCNLTSLFNELLKVPLGKLEMNQGVQFVLLIDALDECEREGKNEILCCIQRHFLKLPPWLYVYLTSRPELPVMEKLKRFNPKRIEPTHEENQRDLAIFYQQVLEASKEKLTPQFDQARAVKVLVEKSGGLFIYASFLAEVIRNAEDYSITQDLVDRFPDDLDGYYEEQLDRMCTGDSECHEWQIAKLVLSAFEPLHVEVIQALLKCNRKDLMNAVKNLSQFFQVDENFKLHAYHKSLVDFLTSKDRMYSDLYVDKEEQHQVLATKCLDLVQEFDLSSLPRMTVTSSHHHPEVISYLIKHGVNHLYSAGRYKDAKELLINIGWLMARARFGDGIGIVNDCRVLGKGDRTVQLIGRAVGLSLNAMRQDYRQLPGQLVGRLGGPRANQREDHEQATLSLKELSNFVRLLQSFEYGYQWLCPLSAAWDQANQSCLMVLKGHADLVNDIAFSSSGRQLASASKDNTVMLWDSESGEMEQCLHLKKEVLAVDYSPDGTAIVTGSTDQKLKIWDSDTGTCEQTIKLLGPVCDVEWSHFGIVSSSHNTISIWKSDLQRLVLSKELECIGVTKGRISPNGEKVIAISSADFTIRIFDISSGICEHEVEEHTARVRSIAISPNNRYMASASSDKSIRIYSFATAECTAILRDHDDSVFDVAFTADSTKLASGSYDNTVRVFDVATGRCERCLRGHTNSVISLSFSPITMQLATGSVDKAIRVWDASLSASEDIENNPAKEFDFVTALVWTPDGSVCFVGFRKKNIKIFDSKTGHCVKEVKTGTGISKLAWTPKGILAATKGQDTKLFDFATGDLIMKFVGHTDVVNAVAYMNHTVVSGSRDSTVQVFDLDTGERRMVLLGHTASVTTVAFSPDGTKIASGSNDKTICIYSLATGACEKVLGGGEDMHTMYDLVFSDDGTQLCSRTVRKYIIVWNIVTSTHLKWSKQEVYAYPPKGFQAFAPCMGVEENFWRSVAQKDGPAGVDNNRVYTYKDTNPCAVFRDGSVVFFTLLPQ